nr:mitogen-activated protein kinase kinase kinase 14-like [Aotus nancymaae]
MQLCLDQPKFHLCCFVIARPAPLLRRAERLLTKRFPSPCQDPGPWGASSCSPDCHLACLLGVKIQIQSLNGEHLHIREFHRVKVGDIATGISSQIPAAAFSLVTKDGQPVRYDMEVPDSGIDLQCTLAPDGSFAWSWRVKHGQLENRP